MIILDNTVSSDDLKERHFVCDLNKCKGACCVEGDLGAPLENEELKIVDEILDVVKPYMSEQGLKAVEDQGSYSLDFEGDYSTTTINNRECAFSIYDENKVLKCAFEQAYNDDKTSWKKPISCHLYPIRVSKYDHYDALNYDRWEICSPACELGEQLKVPVYKFLKEPLIRKYGEKWFSDFEKLVSEGEENK